MFHGEGANKGERGREIEEMEKRANCECSWFARVPVRWDEKRQGLTTRRGKPDGNLLWLTSDLTATTSRAICSSSRAR